MNQKFIKSYFNKDGTKTVLISTAPMERSHTRVKSTENGYCRKGEFCEVSLPRSLGKNAGIQIGNDLRVFSDKNEEIPAMSEKKQNVFGQKRDCIVYKNYFGADGTLFCYPNLFGLNTEIVIPKYTGRHVFTVKVKQSDEDTFVIADSPDYMLFRKEEGIQSVVYTPLAVDANKRWCYQNQVDITEDPLKRFSVITYTVNEEFLKDPDTKYPVILNQSLYSYVHKQSDTAMYSGTADIGTHHLSPYMLIGDRTSKGEGWGFIRFEELYDFDLPADKILRAEYCFYNLFDLKKEIELGAYAIINDWCSINTRWRTKPNYDTNPVKTVKVRNKGRHRIDITRLLIEMMKRKYEYEPPYSVRNSFFLKSLTKDSNLLLAAGDSGIFSPYLKVVLKSDATE